MPVTREEIFEALFAFVSANPAFVTTGRRLVHWTQCSAQPALFLRPYDETVIPMPSYGQRPVYEMTAQLWLYCQNDPQDGPSGTAITDLIDLIDNIFDATGNPNGRQTLGGLVVHCWREGKTLIASGEPQKQSVALLPISILVNDRIVPRPKVANLASTPASGTVTTGNVVVLTLSMNVPITISGGTPSMSLNSGGTATLAGATSGQALTFDYTVGSGDTTENLFVTGFNLNGATAVDQWGHVVDFTIPAGLPVGVLAVNPPA